MLLLDETIADVVDGLAGLEPREITIRTDTLTPMLHAFGAAPRVTPPPIVGK